jgi:hypothetical protein
VGVSAYSPRTLDSVHAAGAYYYRGIRIEAEPYRSIATEAEAHRIAKTKADLEAEGNWLNEGGADLGS